MNTQSYPEGPLAFLKNLDTPEALGKGEVAGAQQATRPNVNAHIHLPPNFSAFDSIDEVIALASQQNVAVLGTSNYYDYSAYTPFSAKALAAGIFPMFGIELIAKFDDLAAQGVNINDPGVPGKMYFCGKGITEFTAVPEPAKTTLLTVRDGDAELIAGQVEIIAQIFSAHGFDTGLNPETIKAEIAERHGCPAETVFLQERHVAMAFQQALFRLVAAPGDRLAALNTILNATLDCSADDEVAIQGLLRTHLMKAGKPAYAQGSIIDFSEGFAMVLGLGGIPCYPVLIDGASPINPYEADPAELTASLQSLDVHCAEFIPLRNDPDILERYVTTMRAAGLVITTGTEHNTLDKIPLTPACRGGASIPESLQPIFYEGACVVAAHQYLSAQGETGYVDEHGKLNPNYANTEERIAAFAELGERVLNTVIARWSRYASMK